MNMILRKVLAAAALALVAVGCGKSDSVVDPVEPGVTVAGLNMQLTGATLTAVSAAALPTADASFAAPVVTIDQAPTSTVAATISVSAAEPFQTVLVQPTGSASYVRIFLPVATTLIGVRVLTRPETSAVVATSATIAVVSGTRTSKPTAFLFQKVAN